MTNTTTPATPDGLARCMLPPTGWACSRTRGHEGPCAARPLVEELARGMLRDELRRTNSGRDFAATWEDESEAWLLNADYAVKFLSTPLADNGLIEELRSEHEELLRSQSFDYDFGDDVTERLEAEITRLGERYAALRTPSQANDAAGQDRSRWEFLERECCDLRSVACRTGGGDADVGWQVVSHHMAEPQERVIAEIDYNNPRDVIDIAMRALNTSQGEG